jgi:MFS transporter, SHS family, lactate transporter
MGAEWPAGAALAMEQWPQRSRGLMGSVLQSSWGLGALLSSPKFLLSADRPSRFQLAGPEFFR